MNLVRRQWLAFVLAGLSFVVVLALYSRMPELVPIHWNIHGEVDGWMAKPWGALLMPLTTLGTALLLAFVPAFASKAMSLERFERPYRVMTTAITGFLAFTTLLVSLAAIGAITDITNWLLGGVGLLLTVLGNLFGKLTRNRFVGIRTPWTLANDEVWLRTHRLGGKLFVATGVAVFLGALVGHPFVPLVLFGVPAAAIPIWYSRRISRP